MLTSTRNNCCLLPNLGTDCQKLIVNAKLARYTRCVRQKCKTSTGILEQVVPLVQTDEVNSCSESV